MIHQIQCYTQRDTWRYLLRFEEVLGDKLWLRRHCQSNCNHTLMETYSYWLQIVHVNNLQQLSRKIIIILLFPCWTRQIFQVYINDSGFFWWFLFSSTVLKCTQYSLVRCSMIKWTNSWINGRSISWTDLFFFVRITYAEQ